MKYTLFLLTLVCLLFFLTQAGAQRSFLDVLSRYATWENHSIAATPDQGFIIGNDLKYPPEDWERHGFYLSKYDSCGLISWAKAYGSPNFALYFSDLVTLPTGGAVAMGQTGFDDLFLMRIDMAGAVTNFFTFDTSNGDQNYSVDVQQGKIMVFGSYYADTGARNYLLVVNEAGQVDWAKSYHERRGPGTATYCADGSFICVNGNLIYKVAGNGDLLWSKEMVGISAEDANLSRPIEGDNGYVVATRNPEQSSQYLFKLSGSGNLQWQSEQIESGFLPSSIEQLSDGNLIMVNAQPVAAESDSGGAPFFIEYDPSGAIVAKVSFDLGDLGRFTPPICSAGDNRQLTIMGAFYEQDNFDYVIRLKPGEDLTCSGVPYYAEIGDRPDLSLQNLTGVAGNLVFSSADTATVQILDLALVAERLCEPQTEHATMDFEDRVQCTDTIYFESSISNASFLWEDGSTLPARVLKAPGQYLLKATTCRTAFDITIDLEQGFCPCEYYIPNAFSPNGDGVNDLFQAYSTCGFHDYDLQIFNRWGELLYRTKTPDQGWDGRIGNRMSPQGVYTYTLSYSWEIIPGQFQEKRTVGTVAVIR